MSVQKFDPNLLRRQYDGRLLRAWTAAEEGLAKKEQATDVGGRRANIRAEELQAKYGMDRGGN